MSGYVAAGWLVTVGTLAVYAVGTVIRERALSTRAQRPAGLDPPGPVGIDPPGAVGIDPPGPAAPRPGALR